LGKTFYLRSTSNNGVVLYEFDYNKDKEILTIECIYNSDYNDFKFTIEIIEIVFSDMLISKIKRDFFDGKVIKVTEFTDYEKKNLIKIINKVVLRIIKNYDYYPKMDTWQYKNFTTVDGTNPYYHISYYNKETKKIEKTYYNEKE
jgi:hypothetical protein